MKAHQSYSMIRFVSPLALFFIPAVSLWVVSFPAEAVSTASTSKPPGFVARMRPLLLANMQQLRMPGAMIYVDDPGQGSWATVILQLVDQGKLRLDDPVSKYQPEVPNGAHITIGELLNMTSGLFTVDDDLGFVHTWQAEPGKVWNPQEELAIAFKHPPYFAPGKGVHYSNTNYILLGLIIEQLTHQPVEEAFQQRIFTPLGMNGSSLPPNTSAAIPDPHPQGYMFGTLLDLVEGPKANAAISTLHDLKIWAKVLATGKLLSAVAHQEQLSFTPESLGVYGMGITNSGGGFLGHNGAVPGFQSWMGYQPQTGATIVVLTNRFPTPDGSLSADPLAGIIQHELFA
jgi:D-alanyl-D-alanine carboxypeptidase